jgi:hypothetical protein
MLSLRHAVGLLMGLQITRRSLTASGANPYTVQR